jgi:predicted O-methyltransferase YrrM
MNLYRTIDQIVEWWKYPQPTAQQKKLLGLYTDVIDTDFTAVRLASEESVAYIQKNIGVIPNFAIDYDLHEWLVKTQLDPKLLATGQVLEFGVATGRTLNHFARLLPHKTIYGFDSFEGLPETWTNRALKGHFARTNLPKVRKNCVLNVGWFNETLPNFVKQHKEPIALLHIDCDIYSSTVTILNNLVDCIVPGTVIMFDEYMNYPGWQQHEFRAWQEHTTKYNIKYQYIGYVSRHHKMAVKIL